MASDIARILVAALVGVALTSCGDDSGGSNDTTPSEQESFCAAGEQLQSDVATLGDIDVLEGGTDAVDEAFSAIRDDVDAILTTGQEVAADDLNDLERSVDTLGQTLDALGTDVTAEHADAVGDAVSDVRTAADALQTTLTESCD